jgi:hypothetical protein
MQDISEALTSPTTKTGAIMSFCVFSFLCFGGGEWLFGGPTAHQARFMQERYRSECVGTGWEARQSEYCRTHNTDGSEMTESEIAARDHAEGARASSRPVVSAKAPSASDRAEFEALLMDASR